MIVLQQSSFYANIDISYDFIAVLLSESAKSLYFVHSKADREASHGLAVENFLSFIRYATFFSE